MKLNVMKNTIYFLASFGSSGYIYNLIFIPGKLLCVTFKFGDGSVEVMLGITKYCDFMGAFWLVCLYL